MKNLLWVLLLAAGCATYSDWTTVKDREVTLTGRIFNVQEFYSCPDIFITDQFEHVCPSWTAVYHGCSVMDMHPGVRIKYSSRSFDNLHTTDGFTIFVRYMDEVTILGE